MIPGKLLGGDLNNYLKPEQPKTEKGYISVGMSKRISFFESTNERWVREKFSTNEELNNPTPIPRISF